MNFIFGVIVLALFIIAVRVIWATVLQLFAFFKSAFQQIEVRMAQRSSKATASVLVPRLTPDHDWELMADTVRKEIHLRNAGSSREADRLDVELQVKQKTMELIKAEIQIAKLELELQKVRPVVVLPEVNAGKKPKRSTKKSTTVVLEESTSKTTHPVYQLRTALKTGNVPVVPTNDSARH